jgi:hypothetical protein
MLNAAGFSKATRGGKGLVIDAGCLATKALASMQLPSSFAPLKSRGRRSSAKPRRQVCAGEWRRASWASMCTACARQRLRDTQNVV